MGMKYVEHGVAEANTVRLESKYAQVGTWSVADYVKEGFQVISAILSGSGPIPGYAKTVHALPTTTHRIKQLDGKQGVFSMDWRRRQQDRLNDTMYSANQVDGVMRTMRNSRLYAGRITFKVEYLTIKDKKNGIVYTLRALGKAKNRRLYVISIDGVDHTAIDPNDMLRGLHNLVEMSCALKSGSHSNPSVCMLPNDDD